MTGKLQATKRHHTSFTEFDEISSIGIVYEKPVTTGNCQVFVSKNASVYRTVFDRTRAVAHDLAQMATSYPASSQSRDSRYDPTHPSADRFQIRQHRQALQERGLAVALSTYI
jgi:hypothetical protein